MPPPPLSRRLHGWWWKRSIAPAGRPLPQRRLFVLPTRFGLGWTLLVIVLTLFGVNYQNSLAYGLAFWLFAVGMVVTWRAWRNLLGVTVRMQPQGEAFAGETARLKVTLRAKRPRLALQARLGGAQGVADIGDIDDNGKAHLALDLRVDRRGAMALPPLRITTRWPLGLVRITAWIASETSLLVFPQPLDGDASQGRPSGIGQDALDFAGLRRYQPGDSPAHLAWKHWSRTGRLQTKVFSAPPPKTLWLDYAACQGDSEARLSTLCAQVLLHHDAGDAYGLRLPGVELPIAHGQAQRRQALEALALWSKEELREESQEELLKRPREVPR